MHKVAQLVSQILHLVRNAGYLPPDHAMAVAGNILDATPLPDAFAALAPALIRQAAIFDPFDRDKLRLAADVNERVTHPPFTQWLKTADDLTRREPMAENLAHPNPETASPDDFLAYMKNQPANISRLPVLLHLWQTGAREPLIAAIRIMAGSPSGLLVAPVMAWGAYSAGEPLLAKMLLDEGVDAFPAHNLRARLALDHDDPGKARSHLLASLEAEPFQPAVIEQLARLDLPNGSVGDDTHICLYTWNKPDLLAQTIASLSHTDLGAARVTILNNGTTTCSPENLEQRIREAAPTLDVNWIHLPVNVGAPAARNWLLSLPEMRAARYVAFLDDDVLLPKHWLSRYIATLGQTPEAVAVGPKCVNQAIRTIQYAFRGFHEIGEQKIRFTPNAPTLMDMGQFDSARPSLTVMGCCHLFHRERLDRLKVPGFDVRFSPSQVDDIEHDLQIWKAGGQVVYDGGVPVIHLQDTGKARTPANIGQAYANHFKMEHQFTLGELEHMDQAVHRADESQFTQALAKTLPSLSGSAKVFWQIISQALP